jgi:hypothetical protein
MGKRPFRWVALAAIITLPGIAHTAASAEEASAYVGAQACAG